MPYPIDADAVLCYKFPILTGVIRDTFTDDEDDASNDEEFSKYAPRRALISLYKSNA